MKHKLFICDRCKKQTKKPLYRYPHVWDKPSNTCSDATFFILLMFCERCVRIFDQLNIEMRNKYLYKDNNLLIKFYKQYRKK